MEIVTPSRTSSQLMFLRFPRAVGDIRLVCKAWRDNSDEHIVALRLHYVHGPTTVVGMRTFLQRFPSVQAVIVREGNLIGTGGYQILTGTSGPMWANAVDNLVPTSFFQGLAGFKALTTLRIPCRFSSVLGLELISSLKTLCLSGTREVLDDDAFSSLSRLTNLTDLDLTLCHKLSSPHGFAPLACFTALTSLNLDRTLATDDVLVGTVSTLSALKHLTIRYFEHRRGLISLVAIRRLQNILPKLFVWK